MIPETAAGMLVARLQLRAPRARTFVVAAADDTPTGDAARGLADALAAGGHAVGYVDLLGQLPPEGQAQPRAGVVRPVLLLESELSDAERARRAIAPVEGYTVVRGGNILGHPATLLLAAVADGAIIAAARGRTDRAALRSAAHDLRGSGGTLLGGVLLDR